MFIFFTVLLRVLCAHAPPELRIGGYEKKSSRHNVYKHGGRDHPTRRYDDEDPPGPENDENNNPEDLHDEELGHQPQPARSTSTSTAWSPAGDNDDFGEWLELVGLLAPRLGDSCPAIRSQSSFALWHLLQRCPYTAHQAQVFAPSPKKQTLPTLPTVSTLIRVLCRSFAFPIATTGGGGCPDEDDEEEERTSRPAAPGRHFSAESSSGTRPQIPQIHVSGLSLHFGPLLVAHLLPMLYDADERACLEGVEAMYLLLQHIAQATFQAQVFRKKNTKGGGRTKENNAEEEDEEEGVEADQGRLREDRRRSLAHQLLRVHRRMIRQLFEALEKIRHGIVRQKLLSCFKMLAKAVSKSK